MLISDVINNPVEEPNKIRILAVNGALHNSLLQLYVIIKDGDTINLNETSSSLLSHLLDLKGFKAMEKNGLCDGIAEYGKGMFALGIMYAIEMKMK